MDANTLKNSIISSIQKYQDNMNKSQKLPLYRQLNIREVEEATERIAGTYQEPIIVKSNVGYVIYWYKHSDGKTYQITLNTYTDVCSAVEVQKN